jgi:hypothetical protein
MKIEFYGDLRLLWFPVIASVPVWVLRLTVDLANRVWPKFQVSDDVLGGFFLITALPIYVFYSRYLMRHPRKKARGIAPPSVEEQRTDN